MGGGGGVGVQLAGFAHRMLGSIEAGTGSTRARYPRMACDGCVCLMCSGRGLHAGMLGSIEVGTESTHARYPQMACDGCVCV